MYLNNIENTFVYNVYIKYLYKKRLHIKKII